ncbi:MAG TPA: hypothetical protein VD861_12195 [Pyrinomonadaceae bacterium]|nr:hypothetical protein [Pyrinomonadaceae bacterium]
MLRFSLPTARSAAGWIDLDISYTYPEQFLNTIDKFAWQATLAFPRCKIDRSKWVSEETGSIRTENWSVLLPGGDMGEIKSLPAPQFHDMPVQLGALRRPVSSSRPPSSTTTRTTPPRASPSATASSS